MGIFDNLLSRCCFNFALNSIWFLIIFMSSLLNSHQSLGNWTSGCLLVVVNLENGICRFALFHRTRFKSSLWCLDSLVNQVFLKETGKKP
jgi:hypothetical protein